MRQMRAVLIGVLTGAAMCGAPAVAAAAPAPPSSDSFYAYSGSLEKIAPGTVLRTRQIELSDSGASAPYGATQVLYRTTDQLGAASATAATIIAPATAGVTPLKLLSYQTAYDGDSDTCRPSYQLEGGQPTNTIVAAETAIILSYVAQGYTVVTSDYEGPTDDYGAGREEGTNTLDAIRAAEHELSLPASTPVGMIGYSGGSIATMWAAEEQPTYAPELNIIGVAAGGIPVDFTHNLAYIDGSSDWAGAIPSVSLGLLRAYGLPESDYLSARGQQIIDQVAQGCLDPTAYPGLTFADLLKPVYQDWQKVPIFIRIFNDSIMGRESTPKEPLLMGVGNADGTGDGVMVAKDVQELAYEYCQRGANVQFHVYTGDNHDEAIAPFESEALQFLQDRYAGITPASGCSSITPGNPLTPLPAAPKAKKKTSRPKVVIRSITDTHSSRGAIDLSRGVVVRLATKHGTLHHVVVELRRGRRTLARRVIATLSTRPRKVRLRSARPSGARGGYAIVVLAHGRTVAHRRIG